MDRLAATAYLTQLQIPNRYSNAELKRLPPGTGFQPTEAMKVEVAAIHENAARVDAERKAQHEANPDLYVTSGENNTYHATNVAMIQPESIHSRIQYIGDLIQSGEAEKYDFYSGNGEQATRSMHEYLYWLQLRAAELDSDGTYSPEMFK